MVFLKKSQIQILIMLVSSLMLLQTNTVYSASASDSAQSESESQPPPPQLQPQFAQFSYTTGEGEHKTETIIAKEDCTCPISMQLVTDPVIISPNEHQLWEATLLQKWIRQQNRLSKGKPIGQNIKFRNPTTRQPTLYSSVRAIHPRSIMNAALQYYKQIEYLQSDSQSQTREKIEQSEQSEKVSLMNSLAVATAVAVEVDLISDLISAAAPPEWMFISCSPGPCSQLDLFSWRRQLLFNKWADDGYYQLRTQVPREHVLQSFEVMLTDVVQQSSRSNSSSKWRTKKEIRRQVAAQMDRVSRFLFEHNLWLTAREATRLYTDVVQRETGANSPKLHFFFAHRLFSFVVDGWRLFTRAQQIPSEQKVVVDESILSAFMPFYVEPVGQLLSTFEIGFRDQFRWLTAEYLLKIDAWDMHKYSPMWFHTIADQ